MNGQEKFNRVIAKCPHAHTPWFWDRPHWSRRRFFQLLGAGVAGYFLERPMRAGPTVWQAPVTPQNKGKNCIFILLSGAASPIDTFNYIEVPGATPSNFNPENIPGIGKFPTGLFPKLKNNLGDIAIVRSMRAWAAVHNLARTWLQIGRNPVAALGDIAPALGSVVAMEKEPERLPTQVFPEILARAKKLRWVQGGAAGVEALAGVMREHPAVLTNFAATFAPAISETAIGMLICLARGINRWYVPQFLARQWIPQGNTKSDHHVEISGRTMGIVGFGGIGQALARRAYYGFDMTIVAVDPKPIPRPNFVAELREPQWLMEMVPLVDVLVAAAPHTPLTEKLFDERVFRAMKKTAYFLALSRGKLIDDMALVRALKEGWIAGAGLDVFPQEPPPADHPIFDCPNVVMTMHTSGWGPDRQKRLIALFCENVRRHTRGLPLLNVVDKEKGY